MSLPRVKRAASNAPLLVTSPRCIDGEWIVPVYVYGRLSEAKTYYTADKADAVATAAALQAWAQAERLKWATD